MIPQLRSTLPSFMVLIVTVAALRAADAPAGAKYQPQLGPLFTEGEAFTYRATVDYQGLERITLSTKTSHQDANGDIKTVRSDRMQKNDQPHFSAELIADAALARKVFNNGTLEEAEFLVRVCELIDDQGNTVKLLPAGTIIGARKQADGQVAFAVNGQAPDTDLAAHLSVLITMGDEDTTANDLLGAPKLMAVGDTWAVNEKAMLNSDLPRVFPGVDRLAGSVALRSAQTNDQGDVRTTVTGTYRLGDVRPPFPSDVIASPSNVRFEITVTAPVKPGPGQYDLMTSVLIHHAGHTGDIDVGMSETDMEVGFTIDQDAHYVLGGSVKPAEALASAPPVPEMPPLSPGMSSAPILRPKGPVFAPKREAVAESNPNPATAPASPPTVQPTPAPPETPAPAAPPPLIVPNDSPFSGAQDLPNLPPGAK
jgi:hypothetical protein